MLSQNLTGTILPFTGTNAAFHFALWTQNSTGNLFAWICHSIYCMSIPPDSESAKSQFPCDTVTISDTNRRCFLCLHVILIFFNFNRPTCCSFFLRATLSVKHCGHSKDVVVFGFSVEVFVQPRSLSLLKNWNHSTHHLYYHIFCWPPRCSRAAY